MLNMSATSSTKKYRYGHIILNLLRAFNIIGFLLVAASSWILIVKSDIQTDYFVFEAISHVVTSLIAFVCLVSELPFNFLKAYFEANWPVLTDSHGFFWLGVAMLSMGSQILGSLNKKNANVDQLTLPLWRLVLATGVLAITFGGFNVICSFIWRVPSKKITARMIRDNGALAEEKLRDPSAYDFDTSTIYDMNGKPEKPSRANRITMLFKKGKKPIISKPMAQNDRDVEAARPAYPETEPEDETLNDIWEGVNRASPIVPGVQVSSHSSPCHLFSEKIADFVTLQRPPTALHPAYTGKSTSSSRYSEVTHLNRF